MRPQWSILIALLAATGALAGCTDAGDDHYADGHTHDADMDHGDMETGQDMAMGHMHSGQHNATAPMFVEIEVLEDPKMGYNLHVTTTGFEWAPEAASTAHEDGKGHAHIYIDGVKLSRLYGEWYYLGSLEPGEHTVKVDLNGNDHTPYAWDGAVVADEVTVDVPAAE